MELGGIFGIRGIINKMALPVIEEIKEKKQQFMDTYVSKNKPAPKNTGPSIQKEEKVRYNWIEGGVSLPYFTRGIMMTLDEVEDFRQRYNNIGIFTTAYHYANRERTGKIDAPYFYLDLDLSELADKDKKVSNLAWVKLQEDLRRILSAFKTFYKIEVQQVGIYFSGKKGLSVLVPTPVFKLEADENLNSTFRLIAKDLSKRTFHKTIDLKIYDNRRLWRMVNSRHEDTGLFKIPLSFRLATTLTLPEIKKLATERQEDYIILTHPNNTAANRIKELQIEAEKASTKCFFTGKTFSYTPPCITNLLQSSIEAGQRNIVVTSLASFFKQHGHNLNETKEILRQFNRNNCSPPLPDREILLSVNSVFKKNYTWGCRTFSLLSKCEKDKCRIAKS